MDIITTAPVYLTASYLNCSQWIGFTVQMYMCMGVCFLAVHVHNVLVSAGMCVCQRPFFLRASTVLFSLAGLLLSPGYLLLP